MIFLSLFGFWEVGRDGVIEFLDSEVLGELVEVIRLIVFVEY